MDDSHKDEENQKDDNGAGVLKSTMDSGDHMESDELADKGNNQDTQAGDRGDAHVPQETGAGFTAHEMEDDGKFVYSSGLIIHLLVILFTHWVYNLFLYIFY